MLWSQKVCRGNTNMLRFTENKGGPGNSSAPIVVNAFHTTNFRSRFAMRCAENHGNTCRDGPTHIPSIGLIEVANLTLPILLRMLDIGYQISLCQDN